MRNSINYPLETLAGGHGTLARQGQSHLSPIGRCNPITKMAVSKMQIESYFLSLTAKLDALKGRVRQIIEDQHWQTDGEWKESVIRQMLRRQLPASVSVGRGFVITGAQSSHQLDVLVFDASKPILFKDGDLVFLTPDAVLGVIEVKSRVNPSIVADAARKLGTDMYLVRSNLNENAFADLFAFEDSGGTPEAYLSSIADAAKHSNNRLDFLCAGKSRFIKYWDFEPQNEKRFYEGWHSYNLPDTAPEYFLHNVIDCVSPKSVCRDGTPTPSHDANNRPRAAYCRQWAIAMATPRGQKISGLVWRKGHVNLQEGLHHSNGGRSAGACPHRLRPRCKSGPPMPL